MCVWNRHFGLDRLIDRTKVYSEGYIQCASGHTGYESSISDYKKIIFRITLCTEGAEVERHDGRLVPEIEQHHCVVRRQSAPSLRCGVSGLHQRFSPGLARPCMRRRTGATTIDLT